jgi:uncharacterized RDD family membrane protein YckC
MAALVIDGAVLIIPLLGIAYLFALAFPHHGFFLARSGTSTTTTASGTSSTSYTYTLPAPALLLVTALSLAYFFVCEAAWEKTVGKRVMGLCVRSSSGGRAGLNAVSARTVLRLIDGIGLYLLGWLVALLTGPRRRRIGDWAGRTVVVRDDGACDRTQQPAWRIAFYPATWLAAVLLGVFALGLGAAVGEGEQAIALVHSYTRAREQGDASLACSMLTVGQQREIVAIEGGSYANAQAGRCPEYILRSEPNSHLLNPGLVTLSESPLVAEYSPLGAVLVYSPQDPGLHLIAIPEDGHMKLDMRGLEKLEFIRGCAGVGGVTSTECACTFDLARDQAPFPENGLTLSQARALEADEARCRGPLGAVTS